MSQEHSVTLFRQAWTVPKDAYSPEQNEDAYRIDSFQGSDGTQGLLVAVSDGATEAIYSRLWSQALVNAAEPDWTILSDDELNERLQQVRQKFSPLKPDDPRPWYVRNKVLTEGSQATLLVVKVGSSKDANGLDVHALAIGDCCLLLFRQNGEVYGFPVSKSEDFGVNPMLVRSLRQPSLPYERWNTRVWVGDLLLVCTDAVGKWAFTCLEDGHASLLFETLTRLLAPAGLNRTDASSDMDCASNPEREKAESIKKKDDGHKDDVFSTVMRLLKQLHVLPSKQVQEDPPDKQQPARPELAPIQSSTDREDAEEDHTEERVSDPQSKFEEFVQSHRAPESGPRMRNDDATLIVCLPLQGTNDSQQHEALEIIRKHKAAAEEQPPRVQRAKPLRTEEHPTGDD